MFSFRYPAVFILAFVLGGTLLGRFIEIPLFISGVIFIAAVMTLIFILLRYGGRRFAFALAAAALAGALVNASLFYQIRPANDIGNIMRFDDDVTYFAKITKWPLLRRHRTTIACRIDSILYDSRILVTSGTIFLTVGRETTRFAYGDNISFHGKLHRPAKPLYPGTFDYSRHLDNKNVRGTVEVDNPFEIMVLKRQNNLFGRSIDGIRKYILDCFTLNLSPESASIASGFLIGETRDISLNVYRAFRTTGTMHLLAVSGSNVALILVVVILIMRLLGIRGWPRFLLLLAVIVIFSHLSYNQPSVVRASLMAVLVLMARSFYRRIDMNNIIAAAAVILILSDPSNLFDIGFQLSFAVTWGLILFLPFINDLLQRFELGKTARYTTLIVFSSLIASLTASPITAYYFGETSLVTVASNLIVVPLVSLTVLGITGLIVLYILWPPLAAWAGLPLDYLLRAIHDIVIWFDSFQFASVKISNFSGAIAIVLLLGVILIFWGMRHRFARRLLVLYLLAMTVSFLAANIYGQEERQDEIEIFNNGYARSLLFGKEGGVVIYDNSASFGQSDFCDGLIPYLNSRGQGMPSRLVMLTGPYRAEYLIRSARAEHRTVSLEREVAVSDAPGTAVYCINNKGNADATELLSNELKIGKNRVLIRFADSSSAVYYNRVPGFDASDTRQNGEMQYIFIVVRTKEELIKILNCSDTERLVLLLSKPLARYNLNADNVLTEKLEGFSGILVDPGQSRRIPF